ncbi:U11/U12 small nuclear ribonucleoprotein 48 kDa protein-like isoform X2 [Mya arenaria]|nr:U11/U12 small nuclear ribonucleoprotein 48 kDa protein-like isoform X2 [Mya arenaria]XP_052767729.1 U11/U12 small nuclear ribonucleoprotein 48 kDa protein-like isoform X2 [Mya arenaria]
MSTSVTASELSSRQQCLDDLDEFISSCQQRITDMLDMFGWTPEHFMQPSMLSTCPHNSDHRMPPSALDKHTLVCELTNQGYTRTDAEKILEDRSYFYKDAACVYPVTLDLETLNSWLWNHHVKNHSVFYGYPRVPQTSEEEQIMLPREDRAALAEYVVLRARAANRLKEVGRDELLVSENLADLIKKETGEGRHLDPVEEMAALRDYRRRRKTYRAKNVHITKKSHTEIMREVINNQMDMYSQSLQDDRSVDREEKALEETGRQLEEISSYRGTSSQRSRSTERSRGTPRQPSRAREYSRQRSKDRYRRKSRSPDRPRQGSRSRETSRQRSRSPLLCSTPRSFERPLSRERLNERSRSKDREQRKHKKKHKHRSRSRSKTKSRAKKKHKKNKHKSKGDKEEQPDK